MSTILKSCCHCCKNCFPDSKMNYEDCEVCKRIGKVCPYGHGKCGNKNNKTSMDEKAIKYEHIKRIGATTPIRVGAGNNRIFPSRPASSASIKSSIMHTVGPALPLYTNNRTTVNPIINYSKTLPLNQISMNPVPLPTQINKANHSYIVKP